MDERRCLTVASDLPLARGRIAEDDLHRALARHPEVANFRPAGWLCHDGRCNTAREGRLIYFDDDHLSASGARLLVPGWIDAALAGGALTRSAASGRQDGLRRGFSGPSGDTTLRTRHR